LDKVASVAAFSRRHFQRIFKEVLGVSPVEYYRRLKIEKIKEKLLDINLSAEQAFADCGVEFHGAYNRLFREKTGKSPTEYRKGKSKN